MNDQPIDPAVTAEAATTAVLDQLTQEPAKGKSKRGFAAMSPEKRREIASKGGRTAHALGKAHQWNTESARAAGRRGGKKTADNRKAQDGGLFTE